MSTKKGRIIRKNYYISVLLFLKLLESYRSSLMVPRNSFKQSRYFYNSV